MRLLEAIVSANHRAAAGDEHAGLHPADFEESLPLVALTCIDPRLNPLLPEVLGIPEAQFIWLRNAGNIITGPLNSTVRSLALACAVKGGREIVIIGHTDCQVCKTSMLELMERFRVLGLEREKLPENLNQFFGLFASERQNVLKAVELVRSSPLIGPNIPVHGLLVAIDSGRLEWLVDGYKNVGRPPSAEVAAENASPALSRALSELSPFHLGEMKFPEDKIGEVAAKLQAGIDWAERAAHKIGDVAHQVGDISEKAQEWLAHVQAQKPNEPPPPPPVSSSPSKEPPPRPGQRPLRIPLPPKRRGK